MSLPHANIRSETSGLLQPRVKLQEQQRARPSKLPPLSQLRDSEAKADSKELNEHVLPRHSQQSNSSNRRRARSMSIRPQTAQANQNSSRDLSLVAESPRLTNIGINGTELSFLSHSQKSQFEAFERDKRQSLTIASSKVRTSHNDLLQNERPHSSALTPRTRTSPLSKALETNQNENVVVSQSTRDLFGRRRSQSVSIDRNSIFDKNIENENANTLSVRLSSESPFGNSGKQKSESSEETPNSSSVPKVPKLDVSLLLIDESHAHHSLSSKKGNSAVSQLDIESHKHSLSNTLSFTSLNPLTKSQSQSLSGSMTAREAAQMLSHALCQRENTDAHIVEVVKTENGTVERRLDDDEPITEFQSEGRQLVLRNSPSKGSENALLNTKNENATQQRKVRQLKPKESNEPRESSSTEAITSINASSSQSLVQEKVVIDVSKVQIQTPKGTQPNAPQPTRRALNINLDLVNTTTKELSAEQVEQSGLLTVRKKDKTPRNGQTIQHSVVGRKNKNLSLVQILYYDSKQKKTMQNCTDKFAFFASLPTATLAIEKDCDAEDVIDSVIEENLFDISDHNPSNYLLYEVTIESVDFDVGFVLQNNTKGIRELSLSDLVFEWMRKWDEETNLHFKFVLGMQRQRAPSFSKSPKIKPNDYEKTIVVDFASGESDNILWIPESDLTFTGKVSSGAYARVYTAKYHDKTVAVKVLKGTLDTTTIKEFQKEFAIFKKTNHENLVHFYGACFNTKLSLVMEYCERNSLVHLMMSASFEFAWEHFFKFGKQMFRGLEYLHNFEPQIIHRDLKSLNLLVTRDLDIRITDFGLSRYNTASNNATLNNLCGTMSHCAPEIYLGERFTTKSDIYSGAMILWEMATRLQTGSYAQPYAEYSWIAFDFQIIIQTAQNGLRPSFPESIDDRVRQIISAGWSSDQNQRPDASQMREVLEALELKWK